MYYKNIGNIEMIRGTYKDELPVFENAEVRDILFDGENFNQLYINLIFETLPKEMPKKWKQKGYNKVGASLECVNMKKFKVNISKPQINKYIYNVEILESGGSYFKMTSKCGSNQIEAVADGVCFGKYITLKESDKI